MLNATAPGVYVIAVTPFRDDGRLDIAATTGWSTSTRAAALTGITILGIMGEAPKLDTAEAVAFARRVVKRAGRMPVVVGVSAPGFAAMRALARGAMEAGAAGVMVAPPGSLQGRRSTATYLRPGAEAIGPDVPFVIQDYPLASGVVMSTGRSAASSRRTRPASCSRPRTGRASRRSASVRRLRRTTMRRIRSSPATAACSSTSSWSEAPTEQ